MPWLQVFIKYHNELLIRQQSIHRFTMALIQLQTSLKTHTNGIANTSSSTIVHSLTARLDQMLKTRELLAKQCEAVVAQTESVTHIVTQEMYYSTNGSNIFGHYYSSNDQTVQQIKSEIRSLKGVMIRKHTMY